MNKRFLYFVLLVSLFALIAAPAYAATGSAHFYSGDSNGATAYGPISAYAAPGNAAWGTGFPAVLCWKHSAWPLISGSLAQYISTGYYAEAPNALESWRWYRMTLPLPSNAINIQATGTMKVNSDNSDRTWLNGTLIGTDGTVEGAYVDLYEWSTVQSYAIPAGSIHAGNNYMDVVVRNYQGANSPTGNPTGYIYDFSVDYTYNLNHTVVVDVKPGSDPSAFNWNGTGKVPVAILGSATFDVSLIIPETVTMNNAGVALRGKKDPTAMASIKDVNLDGYPDLVVQILDTDGNVFPAGAVTATIAGSMTNGDTFTGVTDIKLVP